MIKHFLYRLIFFFDIAAINLIMNSDSIYYSNVVFVDYRQGFIDKAIGFIFGLIFMTIIFYSAFFILILSTWLCIPDFREEYSLRNILIPKSLDNLFNQVKASINCLFNTEKHVILLISVVLLIIFSPEIPIGQFKTYGTLEDFSNEGKGLIDNYFPDSYNTSKYEYDIVVERGSSTEKLVDHIFEHEESKEFNKYFFTNSAAKIRGFAHYEEAGNQEYISYDDIFLVSDYFTEYILSIWDAIMRAIIYGLVPYIIGAIILNREQIGSYYTNQIE